MQELIDVGMVLKKEMDFKKTSNRLALLMCEFNYNIDLIKLHLHLPKTQLEDFDFYSAFKHEFIDSRSQCKLKFSVQEGLNASKYDLSDEEFAEAYIIHGCLPIMRLVPFQIASNVKKYMPHDMECEVNIRKIGSKNCITITNCGPKIDDSDLSQILDSGGRGHDSVFAAGMGLGLKQIQSIIGFHKSWLGSDFSVASSGECFQLNGIKYTTFITKLIFQNEPNLALFDDFINEVRLSPDIIIHNLFGITNKLRVLCDDNLLRKNSIEFKIYLQYVVDVMRQCLYVMNGQQLTTTILGNECPISMQSVIDNSLRNLVEYVYADKRINLNIQTNQLLANIDASSGFYSFVVGILSLILDRIPDDGNLDVSYDGGRDGNLISVNSTSYDFSRLFEETDSCINNNRVRLYQDMIEHWNGRINTNRNSFKLYI